MTAERPTFPERIDTESHVRAAPEIASAAGHLSIPKAAGDAGPEVAERLYVGQPDFLDFSRQRFGSINAGVRAYTNLAETFKRYIREGQTDKAFPLRFNTYPSDLRGSWYTRVDKLDVRSLRDYVRLVDGTLERRTRNLVTTYENLPYKIGLRTHEFYRQFVLAQLGPTAFDEVE